MIHPSSIVSLMVARRVLAGTAVRTRRDSLSGSLAPRLEFGLTDRQLTLVEAGEKRGKLRKVERSDLGSANGQSLSALSFICSFKKCLSNCRTFPTSRDYHLEAQIARKWNYPRAHNCENFATDENWSLSVWEEGKRCLGEALPPPFLAPLFSLGVKSLFSPLFPHYGAREEGRAWLALSFALAFIAWQRGRRRRRESPWKREAGSLPPSVDAGGNDGQGLLREGEKENKVEKRVNRWQVCTFDLRKGFNDSSSLSKPCKSEDGEDGVHIFPTLSPLRKWEENASSEAKQHSLGCVLGPFPPEERWVPATPFRLNQADGNQARIKSGRQPWKKRLSAQNNILGRECPPRMHFPPTF